MKYNFKNMIFAFDIDGTLIPSSSNFIEDKLLVLLKDLTISNKVIFASARPMEGILNLLPESIFKDFNYVSLNGAYSIIDDVEYETNPFSFEKINILINHFSKGNLWLYSKNKWYSSNFNSLVYLKEKQAVKMDASPLNAIKKYRNIHKVIIITKSKKDLQFLESCDFNFSYSNSKYVEVNCKGVNKALFVKQKNINQKQLCSFGDAENDLPLFRISNYSIVMKNSNLNLSKISSYITSNNYYDGITEGLNYINQKITKK